MSMRALVPHFLAPMISTLGSTRFFPFPSLVSPEDDDDDDDEDDSVRGGCSVTTLPGPRLDGESGTLETPYPLRDNHPSW